MLDIAAIPQRVRAVCKTLQDRGFQAVIVGGCVRDMVLGRTPKDWDVATSAKPDEVLGLFRHTIPTGLQHGTVTVVVAKGEHVEVTTFRGEGAYTDSRRPDHVVFGVPLKEDLARRDLVVNAMACDPSTGEVIDPFGGMRDLERRLLRAVGPTGDSFVDGVGRFTEDGLRAMRAVRFAAQLGFDLDDGTARSLGEPSVLASLRKVSRERVSDELRKLLGAAVPSRGLLPMRRSGIVREVMPDVDAAIADEAAWLARVDAAPAEVRLGALFADLAVPGARMDKKVVAKTESLLKALKFSNDEAGVAAKLVGVAKCTAASDAELRRALADVGRGVAPLAVALWGRGEGLLGDALAPGELAVTGKDLMDALEMPPGPAIGKLLATLFERVLADPSLNTVDRLLEEARSP